MTLDVYMFVGIFNLITYNNKTANSNALQVVRKVYIQIWSHFYKNNALNINNLAIMAVMTASS